MQRTDLATFYQDEWVLKYHHGYSLPEQYMMLPYEREMHLQNILNHVRAKRKQGG